MPKSGWKTGSRMAAPRRRTLRHALAWAAAAGLSIVLAGCGFGASAPASKPRAAISPAAAQGRTTQSKAAQGKAAQPQAGLGGALSVIIDNQSAARPQSGLARADMVFEALTEGGITRFLALFWSRPASQIGPVRSTRIYFDQLARAYHLPLAHAGGNVDALKAIKPWHIENIDQIWTPGAGAYFWRTSTRQAPHNLYTSTTLLLKAARAYGLPLGPVPAWPQGTMPGGAKATRLTLTFSGVEQVDWTYKGGLYTRLESGAPDPTLAGNPIRTRSVLILITPASPDPDPYTPGSIKLAMTGSGPGYLAAGGRIWHIEWHRSSARPFTFTRPGGPGPVLIPPAPLWVELMPAQAGVAYSP